MELDYPTLAYLVIPLPENVFDEVIMRQICSVHGQTLADRT